VFHSLLTSTYWKLARPTHMSRISLPGEPEPAWLKHRMEYSRVAAELRAEEKARKQASRAESRPGFISRLLLALDRD
jgi:hypothetical protein